MEEQEALLGTAIGGKYHLLRLVGEGGMARVYEASDLSSGRRVAVKLLHRRHVANNKVFARFQREARIVRSVAHPNIATLEGTGATATGVPYIVMEYLEGHTLAQTLSKDGPLPALRTTHIMAQVLSGLQAAHDAKVVHRDLKPQNIFLTGDGESEEVVKLLDFGVSKLVADGDEDISPLTDTGSVLGTANYMSPEQAIGAKTVSTPSDIYSMGVILYQMLTGRLPFEARNNNALLLKIMIEKAPDPRSINQDIPVEMTEVIHTAMDRNPAKRFADCAEFRSRLLACLPASGGRGHERDRPAIHGKEKDYSIQQASTRDQVKHVFDAIFVRLWTSSMEVSLDDGSRLKVLPLDDEHDLPAALQGFFPRGIVSGVDLDRQALLDQFPDFRSPIIMINLHESQRELAVHEWKQEQGGYVVRWANITNLDSEVNAFCKQPVANSGAPRDLKNIGFSDDVDCENRTFHVATEIVSRGGLKISTKIWRSGCIVDSVIQVLDPSEGDLVIQASELAQTQHTASVNEVLGGKYPGDNKQAFPSSREGS